MGDTLAKVVGPLVAIAIAVISASISIGSSRAEIEVLKDQQKDFKTEIEQLSRVVHTLEVDLATSRSSTSAALSNIDRSLLEIKDDVKDLKRGQISTPPGTVRLK